MLTLEYLKSILYYDPLTGVFVWRVSPSRRIRIGSPAGTVSDEGYVRIKIEGVNHRAHRLAWLYIYGVWPTLTDHINRVRSDNRIVNLREVTPKENRANSTQKPRCVGLGSSFDMYYRKDRNQWRLRRRVGGKRVSVGCFDTKEEAVAASSLNSI